MLTRISRSGLAALMVLVLAGFGLATAAPPASADTIIPINWTVNASTTLKSLGLTVTVPPGTFVGQVDLTTGALTRQPQPARGRQDHLAARVPAGHRHLLDEGERSHHRPRRPGHPDGDGELVVHLLITSATLSIAPWLNLVGNSCRGVSPISVNMSGPVNLSGASTFSSTYTVPKFTGCGFLVTPLLNLIIPGPGNTFTATLRATGHLIPPADP